MELGFVLWIHAVTPVLVSFSYFSIVDTGIFFFTKRIEL